MRHRRKSKSHHRRRHRVGAINVKSVATKVLGVAAGAFVGRTIQNMAVKTFPTVSGKYIGIGTIVLGALVPKVIKSELGQSLGDGILALGAYQTLQNFGVISGLGAIPRRVAPRITSMNGYNANAHTVGEYNANAHAVGKAYNRSTVFGMPTPETELMMGALLYDE